MNRWPLFFLIAWGIVLFVGREGWCYDDEAEPLLPGDLQNFAPGSAPAGHPLYRKTPIVAMDPKTREMIRESFLQGAKNLGFVVQKFEMAETITHPNFPKVPRLRFYVEGYHPDKQSYAKAQEILWAVHQLAIECCTVNGVDHLGPLSLFITKNVKKGLYFARSHVVPN